ncbi:MAG: YgiQ family radical SAM protein [Proteobacteria bacterium]|nr:YgiQ family radical SAM protein [Pseudomonadota bacterium]
MYLPTTKQELQRHGWDQLDVILVTGDSYIDSPYIGVAVIGHVLIAAGFKVGIIAQPDTKSPVDITRLGRPRLFFGVSGGSVDSLVANYTATKKFRQQDDYTPGGENNRRPDRAVITYTNLIRQHFKNAAPIVLGGIEASLRRVAHFDFWSNKVRRSILVDSGADFLIYGMAERSVVELAKTLAGDRPRPSTVRGLSYLSGERVEEYLELPSYEDVATDRALFVEMFHTFYRNNDPMTAQGLYQKHAQKYLIQNPPATYLTQRELDEVYSLDYERNLHPFYRTGGKVRALDTIRSSITTHRGCYGECNFCAIAVHQGRTVRSRSQRSILAEARQLVEDPEFKGYIRDVGGPTANMYGFECDTKTESGPCVDKRCLYPSICSSLKTDHRPQLVLLEKLRRLPGVKQVVVASGVRHDMILDDAETGPKYLNEIVRHHVSGQLKIAPEHVEKRVMQCMGKTGSKEQLVKFKKAFDRVNRKMGKKQFLTYYLIAAHPGCSAKEMKKLKSFATRELRIAPEQVQIFTPTPSTYSTLMYYTETNPFTGELIFVEKDPKRKTGQKRIITG